MTQSEKKFKHLKRKQYRAFRRALGQLSIRSTHMPEVAHDRIREIQEQADILEYAINRWYEGR